MGYALSDIKKQTKHGGSRKAPPALAHKARLHVTENSLLSFQIHSGDTILYLNGRPMAGIKYGVSRISRRPHIYPLLPIPHKGCDMSAEI